MPVLLCLEFLSLPIVDQDLGVLLILHSHVLLVRVDFHGLLQLEHKLPLALLQTHLPTVLLLTVQVVIQVLFVLLVLQDLFLYLLELVYLLHSLTVV